MKKFEYCKREYSYLRIAGELNSAGTEGWQLVYALRDFPTIEVILMREVTEQKD